MHNIREGVGMEKRRSYKVILSRQRKFFETFLTAEIFKPLSLLTAKKTSVKIIRLNHMKLLIWGSF